MFLQCMAKKGASILGSPGGERGKVETSFISPSKMSSKRQPWITPFPVWDRSLSSSSGLYLSFSPRPREEKGIEDTTEPSRGWGTLLRIEEMRFNNDAAWRGEWRRQEDHRKTTSTSVWVCNVLWRAERWLKNRLVFKIGELRDLQGLWDEWRLEGRAEVEGGG